MSVTLTEVNSRCPNPRLLIALHSPAVLHETGLYMCLPEKSQANPAIRCRGVRSLQSGLSRKNREIRACFAYFWIKEGGISLHFRLRLAVAIAMPRCPNPEPISAQNSSS